MSERTFTYTPQGQPILSPALQSLGLPRVPGERDC